MRNVFIVTFAFLYCTCTTHALAYSFGGTEDDFVIKKKIPAIYHAIASCDLGAVEELVEEGVNVNETIGSGYTPLHYASVCGLSDIVEFLLSRGARVNVRSGPFRETPLHCSVIRGHEEIVHMLVRAGANINAQTKYSTETPLYYAAAHGRDEVVRILLNYGADANLRGGFARFTPKDIAEERERVNAFQLLQ